MAHERMFNELDAGKSVGAARIQTVNSQGPLGGRSLRVYTPNQATEAILASARFARTEDLSAERIQMKKSNDESLQTLPSL